VISDTIYAMLHTPASIRRFTKKEIANAARTTEVLLALQVESRERVDELMSKALLAGGKEQREAEDHGFMNGRSFEDPDGHIWEVFWMDPSQMPH
jgi:predicted lactoylglutathione lyase